MMRMTENRAMQMETQPRKPAMGSWLARAARWLVAPKRAWRSRPARQLRLCETLALGERRFLAVVEFERRKFLIGGTANSLALLSELSQTNGEETATKNASTREAEISVRGAA